MSSAVLPGNVLQELDDLQQDVNQWHHRTTTDLQTMHQRFSAQIRALEEAVLSGGGAAVGNFSTAAGSGGVPPFRVGVGVGVGGFPPSVPGSAVKSSGAAPSGLDWEALLTPSQTPQRHGGGGAGGGPASSHPTPSMASPPISHALSYDALIDDGGRGRADLSRDSNTTAGEHAPAALRSRPTPEQLPPEAKHHSLPTDRNQPCQVLVEFKRKRILQFESPQYVAPGEYVVVAGDRGEDIGLVTHTWLAGSAPAPSGRWASGMGKVTRLATVLEVSQLQGVQTELEMRAVEVAQEKVAEHQLPMRIVDAEYQFDRKKLTFYYQSQHRLDFRNLVRDLYKTFRARIWMELD